MLFLTIFIRAEFQLFSSPIVSHKVAFNFIKWFTVTIGRLCHKIVVFLSFEIFLWILPSLTIPVHYLTFYPERLVPVYVLSRLKGQFRNSLASHSNYPIIFDLCYRCCVLKRHIAAPFLFCFVGLDCLPVSQFRGHFSKFRL